MSQELKPCKCCDGGVATHQGGESVHYLRCNNCEWRTHFYESWDKAYAEWNTRAKPLPPAADLPERMDIPARGEYEMDCDWAAAVEQAKAHNSCLDECMPVFTRLQAENAALQQRLNVADQRVDELISAIRTINRGKAYEVRVPGDDEPQYRQRQEWVDWILELCEKPPQQ